MRLFSNPMPFIPHTPESLIQRSDSKDPATTCKGITATGRPCRRPLGTSPHSSPIANRRSKNGVVAVLEAGDDYHDGAAAFFCWQHQEQADLLTADHKDGRRANIIPVQQRTSIDTLVDRLGILEVDEDGSPTKGKRPKQQIRPARKETLPKDWQDMDGPLLAVKSEKHRTRKAGSRAHKPSRQSNLGLFCCVRSVDTDLVPPPRTRPDAEKAGRVHETSSVPVSRRNAVRPMILSEQGNLSTSRPSDSPTRSDLPHAKKLATGSGRPQMPQERPSQTEDLLSLIPKTLPPQTAASLLAELSKPISPLDEEGFIYIFWLTDTSVSTPEVQVASSLLTDNTPSTPSGRRNSDILHAHATLIDGNNKASPKAAILLKIGRASNVQRRMNEWTRQCGYNLSLIRFYPHLPSRLLQPGIASPPSSPNSPSKVPFAHKVERLIHLELADQRVKRNCEHCGKEHREWFEVDSSREGLKKVDDAIKRWTSWSQRMNGKR